MVSAHRIHRVTDDWDGHWYQLYNGASDPGWSILLRSRSDLGCYSDAAVGYIASDVSNGLFARPRFRRGLRLALFSNERSPELRQLSLGARSTNICHLRSLFSGGRYLYQIGGPTVWRARFPSRSASGSKFGLRRAAHGCNHDGGSWFDQAVIDDEICTSRQRAVHRVLIGPRKRDYRGGRDGGVPVRRVAAIGEHYDGNSLCRRFLRATQTNL